MQTAARELFSYRKHWVKRFGTAPFLPMSRAEMDALGWDSCDIILVTGDAYVDHPSFGMALIGRVLEAQGFRVGIISQPDWKKRRTVQGPGPAESVLRHQRRQHGFHGQPLYRRPQNPLATTPTPRAPLRWSAPGPLGDRVRAAGARGLRCDVPIIYGGIEASLRRIAHFDYWSEKVRRSVLLDAQGRPARVYGNAERQIVRDRASARRRRDDRRASTTCAARRSCARRCRTAGSEIDSTTIDTPGPLAPPVDPYAMEPSGNARAAHTAPSTAIGDATRAPADKTSARPSGFAREAVRAMDGAAGAPMDGFTASSRANPEGRGGVASRQRTRRS